MHCSRPVRKRPVIKPYLLVLHGANDPREHEADGDVNGGYGQKVPMIHGQPPASVPQSDDETITDIWAPESRRYAF